MRDLIDELYKPEFVPGYFVFAVLFMVLFGYGDDLLGFLVGTVLVMMINDYGKYNDSAPEKSIDGKFLKRKMMHNVYVVDWESMPMPKNMLYAISRESNEPIVIPLEGDIKDEVLVSYDGLGQVVDDYPVLKPLFLEMTKSGASYLWVY